MSSSHLLELAGKIVIVSLIALSFVVILISFAHLYAKWFWYNSAGPNSHHRRGDFTAGHQEQESAVADLRLGLNPSFLKTIPVFPFDPKDFAEGLDCAVCLSEVCEGEKTRILPKCNHGFHVECIDMWFFSHSTCPICRNPVSDETQISIENVLERLESNPTQEELRTDDSQDFPANILVWGDGMEVRTLTSQLVEPNWDQQGQATVITCAPASSSSSSSTSSLQTVAGRVDLVIDIPRNVECDEDKKSPVSSKMKSIKRILSGSRSCMNPFSRATVDVEPGTKSHL